MTVQTATVYAFDWVPDFAKGQVRDFRVRWALEEAGIGYEVRHVRMGTQSEPEHLGRQPFGQIPALDLGGTPMFESGACVWRIAEESPALLPEDIDRDRAFCWVIAALNSVEPALMALGSLDYFIEDQEAAQRVRPHFAGLAAQRLKRIGEALGANDYLMGDRFTVVDLVMAAVLRGAEGAGLLDAEPKVAAYYQRCISRPACRKVIAEQVAEIDANAPRYAKAG